MTKAAHDRIPTHRSSARRGRIGPGGCPRRQRLTPRPITDRRLDRMDKDLREIRAIVFQGRDTGQPVVVKPEGPDPAVEALQARVKINSNRIRPSERGSRGQVEVLTHDIEEAQAHQNASRSRRRDRTPGRSEGTAATRSTKLAGPARPRRTPQQQAAAAGGSVRAAGTRRAPRPEKAAAFKAAKAQLDRRRLSAGAGGCAERLSSAIWL